VTSALVWLAGRALWTSSPELLALLSPEPTLLLALLLLLLLMSSWLLFSGAPSSDPLALLLLKIPFLQPRSRVLSALLQGAPAMVGHPAAPSCCFLLLSPSALLSWLCEGFWGLTVLQP
jgi:hypothetical protein